MIFECLDGPFSCISLVIVGFNKLDVSSLGAHEGFYCWCGLIISNGECRLKTVCVEAVVDGCEGFHDVFGGC